MSIEWFTLMDASRRHGRPRHPFQDPLEGEDWRGLGWAVSAFASLLRRRAEPAPPQKHRKPVLEQHPAEGRICV